MKAPHTANLPEATPKKNVIEEEKKRKRKRKNSKLGK